VTMRALIPIALSVVVAGCATTTQEPSGTSPPSSAAEVAEQRQRIASFLEGQFELRTISDDGAPRLRGAKIGGPWVGETARLFSSGPVVQYCVLVKIYSVPTVPFTRYVALEIDKNEDGSERISGSLLNDDSRPVRCTKKELDPVQPFSELEEARKKRRQALGKEP
jgi:hypothetical protein